MSSADDSSLPNAPAFRRAFDALVSTLNARQARYAIIGGVAVFQHTRVRTTEDIDALLNVPQIALQGLLDALGERGFTVDVPRNVRELRDEGCTSVEFEGVAVDLLRPLIPAYAHVLERATRADVFGQSAMICSAEGLIVMKLIAMRPQDEMDIRDLLDAYAGRLDVDFIRAEFDAVAPADDPRRAKFERWLREALADGEEDPGTGAGAP